MRTKTKVTYSPSPWIQQHSTSVEGKQSADSTKYFGAQSPWKPRIEQGVKIRGGDAPAPESR